MIDIPGNPYKMFGIPELHKKYKAVPYALYSKKTCTRMCSFLDSLLLSVLLTLSKNITFLFSSNCETYVSFYNSRRIGK